MLKITIIGKRLGAMAIVAGLFYSCKQSVAHQEAANTLFQKMDPDQTNIHFSNDLTYDAKFNIYTYRNFYNGGGVAIGDINNDSLPDIFFTANMKPNKLYLNKGNFQDRKSTRLNSSHPSISYAV